MVSVTLTGDPATLTVWYLDREGRGQRLVEDVSGLGWAEVNEMLANIGRIFSVNLVGDAPF